MKIENLPIAPDRRDQQLAYATSAPAILLLKDSILRKKHHRVLHVTVNEGTSESDEVTFTMTT